MSDNKTVKIEDRWWKLIEVIMFKVEDIWF
jgi:hypothetical protein